MTWNWNHKWGWLYKCRVIFIKEKKKMLWISMINFIVLLFKKKEKKILANFAFCSSSLWPWVLFIGDHLFWWSWRPCEAKWILEQQHLRIIKTAIFSANSGCSTARAKQHLAANLPFYLVCVCVIWLLSHQGSVSPRSFQTALEHFSASLA